MVRHYVSGKGYPDFSVKDPVLHISFGSSALGTLEDLN